MMSNPINILPKYKKLFFIFTSILLFLFSSLPAFVDPDMYWHILLGREIISGLNFSNELTFTCSSYIWTNHSWLADVGIAFIYDSFGIAITTLIFAFIVMLTYIIGLNTLKILVRELLRKNLNIYVVLFFIFSTWFLQIKIVAVRPQIFTMLLTSILFNVLIRFYYNKLTYKKALIIIFSLSILWVNLHGGFIIGLFLLLIFTLLYLVKTSLYIFDVSSEVKDRTQVKNSFLYISKILSFCFIFIFGSLINPFTYKAWFEALINITQNANALAITEWQSIDFKDPWGLILLCIFIANVILNVNSKRRFVFMSFLLILFFAATFYSVRYTLVASVIIPVASSVYFFQNIHQLRIIAFDPYAKGFLKFCLFVLVFFMFFYFIFVEFVHGYRYVRSVIDYSIIEKEDGFPSKAVPFINKLENKDDIRPFNYYDWGGFLSFYSPDIKWFADGRMHMWRCYENDRIFIEDVADITYGRGDLESLFNYYNFNLFVVPSGKSITNILMQKEEWRIVYEDNLTVIFQHRFN